MAGPTQKRPGRNPGGAAGICTLHFQQARPGPITASLLDGTRWLVRTLVRDWPYPAGPQQLPVPLTGLRAGLYLVRLDSQEGARTEKLVIAD